MNSEPTTNSPSIDEMALKRDLDTPEFRMGVAENRWQLHKQNGVELLVGLYARDGLEYILRLICSNFPRVPPTGTFWDKNSNSILDFSRWPESNGGRVGATFRRDWNAGQALYIPCDSAAINSHPEWVSKYPSMIWSSKKGIVQYLEIVHELLNCSDYKTPGST